MVTYLYIPVNPIFYYILLDLQEYTLHGPLKVMVKGQKAVCLIFGQATFQKTLCLTIGKALINL